MPTPGGRRDPELVAPSPSCRFTGRVRRDSSSHGRVVRPVSECRRSGRGFASLHRLWPAGVRQVFFICARCDRGDRYCSGGCRHTARAESLRQAGRRYQTSREGRFGHAARQQRQREKVTHQGPQEFAFSVEVHVPSRRAARRTPMEDRIWVAMAHRQGGPRTAPDGPPAPVVRSSHPANPISYPDNQRRE